MRPDNHQKAIDDLYYKWGVGDTTDHKFRFWEAMAPSNFSHSPTVEQKVAIYEQGWLEDLFPGDFKYA